MPIVVACNCGKRFQAPDTLAGKQAKCPNCGSVLMIPAPQAPTPAPIDSDPLGLGDLRQYEQPQMPGAGPMGAPGGYPLGAPAGNPMGMPGYHDPLAGGAMPAANYGWQQPAAAGYGYGGWPQQGAPPARKSNLVLILSIVGGVAAVLLLLLGVGVIVAVRMATGPSEVAQGENFNDSSSTGQFDPSLPGVDSTSDDSTNPADNPFADGDATAGEIDDSATSPTVDTATTDVPMPPRVTTSPSGTADGGIPPSESPAPTTATLPPLSAGIEKWRVSDANGPRGALPSPDAKLVIQQISWQTMLLPYLGHDELYRKFKLDKSWSSGANRAAAETVVPQFLNPADDRQKWKGYPFDGAALTHYVGMSGIEDKRNVVAATLPRSDKRAGVFGYDRIARPEEITDGLSQTIMVLGSGELAGPWAQGGGATIRGAREPYFDSLTGFGSRGMSQPGAYAMFADGSVREISADVNPQVFRSMCTIHGADSVDQSHLGKQLERLPIRIAPLK